MAIEIASFPNNNMVDISKFCESLPKGKSSFS